MLLCIIAIISNMKTSKGMPDTISQSLRQYFQIKTTVYNIKIEKSHIIKYFRYSLNWDTTQEYWSRFRRIKEISCGKENSIKSSWVWEVISWIYCCEICVMCCTTMSFPCGQQEAEERAGRQAGRQLGQLQEEVSGTCWKWMRCASSKLYTTHFPQSIPPASCICPSLYF